MAAKTDLRIIKYQIFLAVLFFFGLWILLIAVSAYIALIDVNFIHNWVTQNLGVLRAEIRDLLISYAWQPLLSLIVTIILYPTIIKTLAEFVVKSRIPTSFKDRPYLSFVYDTYKQTIVYSTVNGTQNVILEHMRVGLENTGEELASNVRSHLVIKGAVLDIFDTDAFPEILVEIEPKGDRTWNIGDYFQESLKRLGIDFIIGLGNEYEIILTATYKSPSGDTFRTPTYALKFSWYKKDPLSNEVKIRFSPFTLPDRSVASKNSL